MKFIITILLTIILALAFGLYLPWWSIAIAAFAVSVAIPQKPGLAYISGFLGLFLLWGGLACWIDIKNQHILSQRIAQLFSLQNASWMLVVITALLGAVVAGFAALTGSYLRYRK